jgi:RNA polymerase sigma factor (sigma-70 family)
LEDDMKDDAGFRGFIRSERQRLVQYVRSLLRETAELDAEDIVHDVLVKVLERADTTTPLENLGAYVYRSLRNRVIDHMRTRRPHLSLHDAADGSEGKLIDLLYDLRPNVLELLQTEAGKEALFEALAGLSEMERQVIIAHELEGTPFKTLSQMWGVPQNTLLSHKARGMKKLRKHFSDA